MTSPGVVVKALACAFLVVIPGSLVLIALYLLSEKLLSTPDGRRRRAELRQAEQAVARVPTTRGQRHSAQVSGAVRS